VRSMGAEIIIAVHLAISPASAQGIQSAFSILSKSVNDSSSSEASDSPRAWA
jgi:hypothetical protein